MMCRSVYASEVRFPFPVSAAEKTQTILALGEKKLVKERKARSEKRGYSGCNGKRREHPLKVGRRYFVQGWLEVLHYFPIAI